MNRVLILIGGVALMALLTGCDQDPAEEKPSPSAPAPTPSVHATAPRAHPVTQETRGTYQFYCVSVNALIITVALPVIANMIPENKALLVPTIILMVVCVTSMIYATLATRPIKMSGFSSLEDIRSMKSNLFFFGNFFKMKYTEYAEGIEAVIQDEDILDNSITRDLFFLGKSLGAKYTNLRVCYSIFMYGIIVTVIASCIAFVLSSTTPI